MNFGLLSVFVTAIVAGAGWLIGYSAVMFIAGLFE